MYELKTTNTKLASHIKAIQKLDTATKKAVFETAVRLNIINTEDWAKEEGFKNTAELAQVVFGYSRSTTLNYIKIASKFLDVRIGKNNKMDIATIQARRDDNGNVIADYNIGQLNAIGKLSQADFIQLDREDVIDPSMTQQELKEAVKAWENQFLDESDFEEQEQEQENAQDKTQEQEQESQEETAAACIECIAAHIARLENMLSGNDSALNIIATINQNLGMLYNEV